jgi:signal transduction histidine kinase
MAKTRLTPAELDARLKFILGITLGTILLLTAVGILYGLLFVSQPIGAQSENDKMFFNVLGSVATFITGTLAGLLIGQSGAKDIMAAQLSNKEMDAKNTQADKKLESELEINELKAEVEADSVRARLANKPDGAMPEEKPVDTDWDKD